MKALIGLGNPGPEYADTRHNLGFVVADRFAERRGVRRFHTDGNQLVAKMRFAGDELIVVKPLTFMNRSGLAVRSVVRRHGLHASDLIVAHDDLDLELGDVRVKIGGGHGGHNGLRSLIDEGDAGDFLRVRLGISRDIRRDTAEWVLERFPASAMEEVNQMVERAADAVEAILLQGGSRAMNQFNRRKDPAKTNNDGAGRGAPGA